MSTPATSVTSTCCASGSTDASASDPPSPNSRPDVRKPVWAGTSVACTRCVRARARPCGDSPRALPMCGSSLPSPPDRETTMDVTNRRELARRALDGYLSGPAASTQATARALAKVDNAAAVVLVEGISDQIALETAAVGRGRDLDAERVVIVPIGGAHAIGRFLTRCGPPGARVGCSGMCGLAKGRNLWR